LNFGCLHWYRSLGWQIWCVDYEAFGAFFASGLRVQL
jgi:hypothetical protein